MIKIIAVVLLTVSSAAFAERRQGCNENASINAAVACNPNTPTAEEFATVPVPGTLALVALGLTGFVVSGRKRR